MKKICDHSQEQWTRFQLNTWLLFIASASFRLFKEQLFRYTTLDLKVDNETHYNWIKVIDTRLQIQFSFGVICLKVYQGLINSK